MPDKFKVSDYLPRLLGSRNNILKFKLIDEKSTNGRVFIPVINRKS